MPGVRGALPFPHASVSSRGPGWGLAVMRVRAEAFPARRSLSAGRGGPWPRCSVLRQAAGHKL